MENQQSRECWIPLAFDPPFGDGLNDIKMLSTVTNSVAMGNAEEEVKAVAKYVTKSVEENGIYHGLQMCGYYNFSIYMLNKA